MIDITQADAYFRANHHTHATFWGRYSKDAREGAVAEAKRLLARALRRELCENLPAYKLGDTRRDDFATFEQALFLLRVGASSINGGSSPYPAAVPVAGSDDQEPEETYAGGICKAALAWLGIPAMISVRG